VSRHLSRQLPISQLRLLHQTFPRQHPLQPSNPDLRNAVVIRAAAAAKAVAALAVVVAVAVVAVVAVDAVAAAHAVKSVLLQRMLMATNFPKKSFSSTVVRKL
jgi:hypothetical protein